MKDPHHYQKKYGMQEEIKSEGGNLHYSNNIFFYLKKKPDIFERHKKEERKSLGLFTSKQ